MNDFLNCSRRDFLQLAGAGAVGAAAAGTATAVQAAPAAGPAVVVHDPDFAVPPDFTTGLAATVVALNGDPVRLWRDGLKSQVASGGALYGLTLWADLLIFQGLAAELRRHVRVVRQDAQTGRFAWMIA
jgi:hypothetical protein